MNIPQGEIARMTDQALDDEAYCDCGSVMLYNDNNELECTDLECELREENNE